MLVPQKGIFIGDRGKEKQRVRTKKILELLLGP